MIMSNTAKLKDNIIRDICKLKNKNPDQIFCIETPNGTVSCKLSDAIIYVGMDGSIVIDSE